MRIPYRWLMRNDISKIHKLASTPYILNLDTDRGPGTHWTMFQKTFDEKRKPVVLYVDSIYGYDVEEVSDETREYRHLIYLISAWDKLGRPSFYVGKTEVNVKGNLTGSLDQQDEAEMERFAQHMKDNPKIPKGANVEKLCVTYCVRDSVDLAELEGEWIREYEKLAEEMDGEVLNVQLTNKANKKVKKTPKVKEHVDVDVPERILMERSEAKAENMEQMNALLVKADLGEISFVDKTYKYLYEKDSKEHKCKKQLQSKVMKAGEKAALVKLWTKIIDWLDETEDQVLRLKALSAGLIGL